MDGLKSLIRKNDDNEKKLVQYLLCNIENIHSINLNYLYNEDNKNILECAIRLSESGYKISKDNIKEEFKRISPHSKLVVEDLFNVEESIINGYDFKYLYNTVKRYKFNIGIADQVDKIAGYATGKGEIDNCNLDKFINNITEIYSKLDGESSLIDTNDLMDYYDTVLQERSEGKNKKTFGITELDSLITRPAHPCEMTAIVAQKGSGKSITAKLIENSLINKGVCVVSFNIEMGMESNLDRLLCLRGGFSPRDLIKEDKTDEESKKIKSEQDRLRSINNYIYYNKPDLSIAEFDRKVSKAKNKLKEKGELPEDGYMVCVIDLVDAMEDFDDADPKKIKRNVNKLHRIAMRENIHIVLILQANELKFRNGKMFKNPDDLNYYKVGLEDIEGSSSFSQRCRVVISLNRPLDLKRRFFPELEEEFKDEIDYLNVHVIKQNDGPLGFMQMAWGDNFRFYPVKGSFKQFDDNESGDEEDFE